MKKIPAIVAKASDGTYTIHMENEMFSGVGNSVEAAKADMLDQINAYIDFCKDEKRRYPEFLDGQYEIVYQFDTQSLLEYYSGILTPAALERLTGINQKQISTYIRGTKPQKAQREKIENALHQLGGELISISVV